MVVTIAFVGLFTQALRMGTDGWVALWAASETGDSSLSFWLTIYAGWVVTSSIMACVRDCMMQSAELNAASRLHNNMLKAVMASPVSFFDTTPLGRLLNRFSSDQDRLDSALPNSLNSLFNCMMQVIGAMLLVCYLMPAFGIALVPLVYLYYQVQKYYTATARDLKRLDSLQRSPMYALFTETVTGVQCVRAFKLQSLFAERFHKRADAVNQVTHLMFSANRWLGLRVELMGAAISGLAAASALGARWLAGGPDPLLLSSAGLALSFAMSVTNTLGWSVRMVAETETNMTAVERVGEYAELPPERSALEPDGNAPAAAAEWPTDGGLNFVDVSMRYRPGLPLVLQELSVRIAPNQRVGVCGRTGAGKSSIVVALFRLTKLAGGHIELGGSDIASVPLITLRNSLSIVPQEPILFVGSLRLNLDPAEHHTDEELWRVLRLCRMGEAVQTLQDQVAENGDNFSVGERQLLCLARAFLRTDAKVLVLDEATAAVDYETDAAIQAALRAMPNTCTVLTIAHRLDTIMDYDRVLVMDTGRAAEFDEPNTLMQDTSSRFYGLVSQMHGATNP